MPFDCKNSDNVSLFLLSWRSVLALSEFISLLQQVSHHEIILQRRLHLSRFDLRHTFICVLTSQASTNEVEKRQQFNKLLSRKKRREEKLVCDIAFDQSSFMLIFTSFNNYKF